MKPDSNTEPPAEANVGPDALGQHRCEGGDSVPRGEFSTREELAIRTLCNLSGLSEDTNWVRGAVARLRENVPSSLQVHRWSKGQTLDGRFELEEELGRGAFGIVFRAQDRVLSRPVAIKVLHPAYSAIDRYRKRFEREAQLASSTVDDHIVSVYNVDVAADGTVYLVMELVTGHSLAAWTVEGQRPSIRRIAQAAWEAAQGLSKAHQAGLVHRDIKCSNLLVDDQGTVKITDFGLARVVAENTTAASMTEELAGTLPYMSPEQISSPARVDGRTDIYSLGVVLFELLASSRPFRGTPAAVVRQIIETDPSPLSAYNPTCPRDLITITEKCLQKEAARRYQTAGELADDLRRWLEDRPIKARPVSVVERGLRWGRRNPYLAALSCLILLTAIVSAILATHLYLEKVRLNRALELAFQLLRGIEKAEFQTIDDAYAGLLQGSQRLSADERQAVMPLFMAAYELQEAARQANVNQSHSASRANFIDIMGQLQSLRRIHSALDYLDESIAHSDRIGLSWLLRAQIRQEILLQPPEDVLADWDRAIYLLSDCSAAHAGRGWCFKMQGRNEEAIAELSRAIQLDAGNEFAHFGLGEIRYLQNEFAVAAQHYEATYSLPPRFNISAQWRRERVWDACYAHWGQSVILDERGETTAAMEHTIRAIELAKDEERHLLWSNLLELLLRAEADGAEHVLERLRQLALTSPSDHWLDACELVSLVASQRAGSLTEADLDRWQRDLPRAADLAAELDSRFWELFVTWLDSTDVQRQAPWVRKSFAGLLDASVSRASAADSLR